MLCFCFCVEILSSYAFAVKETEEAEELEERDEEVDDNAVPVETESYVKLKKKMANKHNMKIENLLQENGKLCREFQRKQVKESTAIEISLHADKSHSASAPV